MCWSRRVPSHQSVAIARVLTTVVGLSWILSWPSVNAIDYTGGWLPGPRKTQCVDICASSVQEESACVKSNTASCRQRGPGEYDYLVFEQLFVPQFCRDLRHGVDPTVSHRNVNPFPMGIQCNASRVASVLTIHGLWPNNRDSYPACCAVSTSIPNRPFHAAAFAEHQSSLLEQMSTQWIDATQPSTYDTLCEIYNHEFQKHGLCFAAFGDDYEKAAVHYFQAALQITSQLEAATRKIQDWAKGLQPQTSLGELEALYSMRVQVLCSNVDGEATENALSAIRTCYEKPGAQDTPFKSMDCPVATTAGAFKPCRPDTPVTLLGYSPLMSVA
ncbi:hypothetical protein Poli38472_004738 [Pythium oligandrum]|uniref:Uncharacterized protein n=1 Tax=Pythium oligandrum TaxID=41045 RepID=A0A8K1FG61_PYTOL|nr:hypothetical protein Poli38472_004738 [Pythium oligandrum]|eukprot:TMW59669.1 hypothetical protein Poli38472_004738 [Pythium oligandrum]